MYGLGPGVARLVIVATMVASMGCARRETDDANQLSFSSPDSATATLVAALENHDVVTLRRLLGRDRRTLGTGDTASDRRDREAFSHGIAFSTSSSPAGRRCHPAGR
jgi:hypothetical protein